MGDCRELLRQPLFGRLPRYLGRECPDCGCRARAYKSTRECTYYRFGCGAVPYKQSRSIAAIRVLRLTGRSMSRYGCATTRHSQDGKEKARSQKAIAGKATA